jgi:sugar O-acyltransferase (sialic acid O-acetyltransferase NeuD family)
MVQKGAMVGNGDILLGFVDDNPAAIGTAVNGLTVFSLDQIAAQHGEVELICAVGDPCVREKLARRCADRALRFATLVSTGVILSPEVSLGEGSVVCEGSVTTTNIRVGRHVHINVGCTVSHDVVIDDFASLNPGAHINGWVHIGKRAYIGAGAIIKNGSPGDPLVIGEDAVVGAGACVVRPVIAGTTVAGVPAKPLERRL